MYRPDLQNSLMLFLPEGGVLFMEEKLLENRPVENPMGTANISGLVLKTGLPLMISLLINSLYNFVDSVFVARISEDH